jgi:large subunit ribosomal protein L17
MRHRVAHRKLGRLSEHRLALLRSQATALIRHERIETTLPKAKELRPFVERLITIAKRSYNGDKTAAQKLFARRLVLRDLSDRGVVAKLFDKVAPRFEERPGGYTRILKLGFRRGDGAEVAQLELVGSEYSEQSTSDAAPAASKGKSSGRLRAAAKRLRGRGKGAGSSEPEPSPKAEASAEGKSGERKSRTGAAKSGDKPKRARKKEE